MDGLRIADIEHVKIESHEIYTTKSQTAIVLLMEIPIKRIDGCDI